jgi:hypothetical protein
MAKCSRSEFEVSKVRVSQLKMGNSETGTAKYHFKNIGFPNEIFSGTHHTVMTKRFAFGSSCHDN